MSLQSTALKGLGLILAIGVAISVQACSGPSAPALPETYGLYARNDNHLVRLDGSADWEKETWPRRSNLSPRSVFIVYDRALADAVPDEVVLLQRVAWVRYQVTTSADSDVRRVAEWAVTDLPNYRVRLDFRPVEGTVEMIEAQPRQELQSGLYSLKLRRSGSSLASRFGVGWDDIERERYERAHCVDRYVDGDTVTYRPCSGNAAGGLLIEDIKTSRVTVDGTPVLLISGAVRNSSGDPLRIPPLKATLKTTSGAKLDQWTFSADRDLVAPGASAGFRTTSQRPPEDTLRVQISLTTRPTTAGTQ